MHRRKFVLALTGLLTTAMTAGIAEALPTDWYEIGRLRVAPGPSVDHDTFFVTGAPPYKKLRLRVTGNSIKLVQRVKITFKNGDTQHIPVPSGVIPAGSWSPVLDLVNVAGDPSRRIRKVEFWYKRPPVSVRPGVAVMHLYGKI
jgi:hypothetical protein